MEKIKEPFFNYETKEGRIAGMREIGRNLSISENISLEIFRTMAYRGDIDDDVIALYPEVFSLWTIDLVCLKGTIIRGSDGLLYSANSDIKPGQNSDPVYEETGKLWKLVKGKNDR